MASTNTQKVNERLALAEQAAAAGNMQAAVNYANAALAYSQTASSTANINKIIAAYSAQPAAPTASSPSPSGGSSGPSQADIQASADAEAAKRAQAQRDYEQTQRSNAARDTVAAAFAQYGLSSLYSKVVEYATAGYNADAIMLMLRDTPEYKARFPAMAALAAKGRAISEGQYIDYERQAAGIEQLYGYPQGMISGQVTNLLTNDVSISELEKRAVLAAADSLTAPQDLRDQISAYYNVNPNQALRAYYLDPDIAVPILEKQSAAARIGVWAKRQGVTGVDVADAEWLQGLGVTEAQAQAGFGNVKAQEGLSSGYGDVADQDALIGANVAGDATDANTVRRAAQARKNRFAGGGQLVGNAKGAIGAGSSSV